MSKAYVFLADGFEEIEGLTVVDVLRRGGVEVVTASIMEDKLIHGSHKIDLYADELAKNLNFEDGDLLVLPGGLGGTNNLMASALVEKQIKKYAAEGKFVSAICAAPSVLGMKGLLNGKKAISYPGFEEKLIGAKVISGARVVVDGNIITSRGMGTALDFSLELLGLLEGEEKKQTIANGIQYK